MHLIPCPWCGPRNESEFVCAGPVRPPRPEDAASLSDEAWVERLIVRPNPKGPVSERWWHMRGCGTWFVIERNTLSHEIEKAPDDGA